MDQTSRDTLSPNPKNSLTVPIIGAQQRLTDTYLQELHSQVMVTNTLTASALHSSNTQLTVVIRNSTSVCRQSHTQMATQSQCRHMDTLSHMVSFSQMCYVKLAQGARMVHMYSQWGHEAGNMGDGKIRCGDTGREMAAKADLAHRIYSSPTTEDGPVSWCDQHRGG